MKGEGPAAEPRLLTLLQALDLAELLNISSAARLASRARTGSSGRGIACTGDVGGAPEPALPDPPAESADILMLSLCNIVFLMLGR